MPSEERPRLPRVSVVCFGRESDSARWVASLESVRRQDLFDWELCLIPELGRRVSLEAYRGIDPRIRIVTPPDNTHPADLANLGAELTTGAYLTFVEAGDLLAPNALSAIVKAASDDEKIDLLYSDEDRLDDKGSTLAPQFKPKWSPEHLLSAPYVGRLYVVRKRLFFQVGGFRAEYGEAYENDLIYRISRLAQKIHHVPEILIHRRRVATPALAPVRRALTDHARQLDPHAIVEDGLIPQTFRVRPAIPAATPVTLLILTHDTHRVLDDGRDINLVRNTIESINAKTTFANYHLLVIDDGNASEEAKQLLRKVGGRLVSYPLQGRFNFAHKLNWSMNVADTEQVIILNDDLEVIAPGWIEALMEWSCRPEIGAVGARLLYPNRTIQHAGMCVGGPVVGAHLFYQHRADQIGYGGSTHIIRNYSAVTAAVLATRKSIFFEVGGFEERLATDFNDVDFCLKLGRAGYRIVYTPYCELIHLEGSSIRRTSQDQAEVALFRSRWPTELARDPYVPLEAIRRSAAGSI